MRIDLQRIGWRGLNSGGIHCKQNPVQHQDFLLSGGFGWNEGNHIRITYVDIRLSTQSSHSPAVMSMVIEDMHDQTIKVSFNEYLISGPRSP